MTKLLVAVLIVCSICLISSKPTFAASAEDCKVTMEFKGQKFCFKDEETKANILGTLLQDYVKTQPTATQSIKPDDPETGGRCCLILAGCGGAGYGCCACLCGYCPDGLNQP